MVFVQARGDLRLGPETYLSFEAIELAELVVLMSTNLNLIRGGKG